MHTLSLHDALPIYPQGHQVPGAGRAFELVAGLDRVGDRLLDGRGAEQAHARCSLSTGNRSVRHASPSATSRRMGRAQRNPSLFLVMMDFAFGSTHPAVHPWVAMPA